ncbi:unnamed protein product [Heligmosomoides polygyrus]|uniref:Alpha-galactosidase n=1 Tax=Heligmosomoides polygyrus TaxID=6339 RepID=A0A183G923_HELPZ|nr:unnamed protein product [Heligmosomoides polygyrus]
MVHKHGSLVQDVRRPARGTVHRVLNAMSYAIPNSHPTPPMGWMSWTQFKCQIDCEKYPDGCISEKLYKDMADQLVYGGYREAGYNHIHIDDCWLERTRDADGRLVADKTRFPSGIKALSDYMHSMNLFLGIYEDWGNKTCAGYPGSNGHVEASFFSSSLP